MEWMLFYLFYSYTERPCWNSLNLYIPVLLFPRTISPVNLNWHNMPFSPGYYIQASFFCHAIPSQSSHIHYLPLLVYCKLINLYKTFTWLCASYDYTRFSSLLITGSAIRLRFRKLKVVPTLLKQAVGVLTIKNRNRWTCPWLMPICFVLDQTSQLSNTARLCKHGA